MTPHHGLRGYKHDGPFLTPTQKRCLAYPFFGLFGLACLAVLTGCATSPRVSNYSWGQIVKADQHSVNSACADVDRWDDGTKKYRNDDVNGCATLKDGKCTIWVVNTIDGVKSLPHELAHCDGVDNPDKAGYGWD